MTAIKVRCAGCRRQFTAGAPHAKWCSSACKRRAARARATDRAAADESAASSAIVERLREDLDAAGAADSFEGLLALEVASQVVKASPQGFVTLVRELRSLVAAATGTEPPPAPAGDEPPAPADAGLALVLDIEKRAAARRQAAHDE